MLACRRRIEPSTELNLEWILRGFGAGVGLTIAGGAGAGAGSRIAGGAGAGAGLRIAGGAGAGATSLSMTSEMPALRLSASILAAGGRKETAQRSTR